VSLAVGLVGFGLAGRVLHAPLVLSAGLSIRGVVTRQADAVRALCPEAKVVDDLAALLDLAPLDLIVIASPNQLHAPQALAALERGKHVVIDKPFALDTVEADRVLEAALRARVKLAVFQNRRWDSDFLTLRRLLAQGALGEIVAFEARWDRFRPHVADRWRERSECGGGVLNDLGPHLLDQALGLFGSPEWLQAQLLYQRPGALVDDGFEIQMGRGALRLSVGASSLACDHALRYRLHGRAGSFRKSGVDVQEQQLHAGLSPLDPAFGIEPQAQWGRLVRAQPLRAGSMDEIAAG